jgi:hypothetical protein
MSLFRRIHWRLIRDQSAQRAVSELELFAGAEIAA